MTYCLRIVSFVQYNNWLAFGFLVLILSLSLVIIDHTLHVSERRRDGRVHLLSSQKSEGMGLNFEWYLKDTVHLGSKSHPI